MRRVWGLTWAGWLNCLLLQWLCLRLSRLVEADDTITGWSLRWAPIWRIGWSLPSRTPLPAGYLGGPGCSGVVTTVDDTGGVRRGVCRHEALGEFVTSAAAGEVAPVRINFGPQMVEAPEDEDSE